MGDAIARYAFCPNCGEPTAQRKIGGRARDVCERCGGTYFQNPTPAVAVVILDEGRILLARRDSMHFRGEWYIPGGFVEADETVQQAAMREAKEELGLDVELVAVLAVSSGFEVPGRPVVGVYYLVRPTGGELRAGDDVDKVAYYPLAEVPELPFEGDRTVIKMLTSMTTAEES